MENKNLTIQRINEVTLPDAMDIHEEDFMLTHMPFRELVDYIKSDTRSDVPSDTQDLLYENAPVFSENSVLDYLIEEPDLHKMVMILGPSGSGKSHLVRWLYYQYVRKINHEEGKDIPLLIPREHNSLGAALSDILQRDILPSEVKDLYLKKLKGSSSSISEVERKEILFNHLKTIVKFDESDDYIDEEERDYLFQYLDDRVVAEKIFLAANGPIAKIFSFMEKGEQTYIEEMPFTENNICFPLKQVNAELNSAKHQADPDVRNFVKELCSDQIIKENVCGYLNSIVSEVIDRASSFKGEDLIKVFEELRSELKKRNQTISIFIEDINSITGIDRAILEVMRTNHSEKPGLCRIMSIVGSTNSYYDKIPTNIQGRFTRTIYILERSLLRDADWKIEFAARYINAMNVTRAESKAWLDKEAPYPVYKGYPDFSYADIGSEKLTMFPFNRNAVLNLYDCLSPSSKTPREFLRCVIKNVELKWVQSGKELISKEINFMAAGMGLLRWNDDSASDRANAATEYQRVERGILIKVWGNGIYKDADGKFGGVDDEVYELFGVKKPQGTTITIEPVDVQLEPPIQPKEDPKYIELQEDRAAVREWAMESSKFLYIDRKARSLIRNFILENINWEREGIPVSVPTGLFAKNILGHVCIEGKEEDAKGFIVRKSPDSERCLLALLARDYNSTKGLHGWNYEGGEQDQIYAFTWLKKNKADILKYVKNAASVSVQTQKAIIRARLIIGILQGTVSSLNNETLLCSLFTKKKFVMYTSNENWNQNVETMRNVSEGVYKLMNDYFRNTIGSYSAENAKFVFLDAVALLGVIDEVLDKGILSTNDSTVKNVLNSVVVDIVNATNTFASNCNSAITIETHRAKEWIETSKATFGETHDTEIIKKTLSGITDYAIFARNKMKINLNLKDYSMSDDEIPEQSIKDIDTYAQGLSTSEDSVSSLVLIATNMSRKMNRYKNIIEKVTDLIKEVNNKALSGTGNASSETVAKNCDDLCKNIDGILARLEDTKYAY